ncbi:hypothetical protein ACLQ2R_03610 [Streptosporangium sp. DT93]|uniref:hypothetical protein n=1 Tax=Streptosporangium sp. DT93 TaxID=3393428 RepID=UPI003CF8E6E5
MNNPSAPVLDRPTVAGCHCFADVPPLPMGCAACGHAPYAHGCPGQAADHEYLQPSAELVAQRLDVRHRLGLGQTLPTFEPARPVTTWPTPVPAPRQAEPTPSRTRPAGRTDLRRPAAPGGARPHRQVETRADRALRLALARDPLTRRRARAAAHALHPAGASIPPPRPGETLDRPPLTLPSPPSSPLSPEQWHQTLRPGLAVALGRNHPPDTTLPRRYELSRWQEVAA